MRRARIVGALAPVLYPAYLPLLRLRSGRRCGGFNRFSSLSDIGPPTRGFHPRCVFLQPLPVKGARNAEFGQPREQSRSSGREIEQVEQRLFGSRDLGI